MLTLLWHPIEQWQTAWTWSADLSPRTSVIWLDPRIRWSRPRFSLRWWSWKSAGRRRDWKSGSYELMDHIPKNITHKPPTLFYLIHWLVHISHTPVAKGSSRNYVAVFVNNPVLCQEVRFIVIRIPSFPIRVQFPQLFLGGFYCAFINSWRESRYNLGVIVRKGFFYKVIALEGEYQEYKGL